ncbi:sodium/hydrogen exchanger [Longispora fulva]|uniref:Cell volume regulation protein A n=1 Tax=Longispora fulva TaxID=619741 RepID=A0A8J7GE52_9ACTN|nr:cation:proton antiporter [Longispora fulva]MBG6137034.1 cell volume regulation protein A [Longispora fulva]GIG61612.1 sodium/hydrogen exchanger [Longispora fulva]
MIGVRPVRDVLPFGLLVGLVAVAVLAAVLSNRLSERSRIPAPVIFLVAAAGASDLFPALGDLSVTMTQRVVTVALVVILFDGGMHIGRQRLRTAAGAIVWLGVAGTFVTAGAVALAAHGLFGLDWSTALLLGAALAPTDPAVVFSVLGRKEITGRSGVILEGESGANDPVGIALMVALLAATGTTGFGAVTAGVLEFTLQMGIGAAVGLAGGAVLAVFIRRVPLPSAALYPLRTLASAFVIYGAATVAHGSGFLAVFVAGIVIGDLPAPYKGDTRRVLASLASLAEIVAFTVLGLTVTLGTLGEGHAWQIGLALAVLLAFVIRPLLVGLLLARVNLTRGERVFVLWSGLKGAVPILLGTFILTSGRADTLRIYDIIFVVVAFSVAVQGGLVPAVARWCRIPMRTHPPEPWSLGVRLRHEPDNVRRFRVVPGARADGVRISDLDLPDTVWVSLISRGGHLLSLNGETVLRAGDDVTALVDPDDTTDAGRVFTALHP